MPAEKIVKKIMLVSSYSFPGKEKRLHYLKKLYYFRILLNVMK